VPGPRPAAARRLEQLLGPRRRLLTGSVGVEEGDDLVAVASQEPELGWREGGAERGDRAGEPVLMAHEAVDVALHEEGPVLRLDRGAREVGGVEQVALDVERRLG